MRKELDLLMKHVYKKSSANDERSSQEDNQAYENESDGDSDDMNESDNPDNMNESNSDPDGIAVFGVGPLGPPLSRPGYITRFKA
ncbi:putative gibberellin 2-beta-dioxygenase 2-like [Capsicum annuum]|nr:putative gibberellin 2-beta-dioxygenase 2-like [Capsicum annuum]